MRRRTMLAALLVAALGLAPGVRAAVMEALDLAQLTARADQIVMGLAKQRSARWDGEHRFIVTDVRLRVTRAIKGPAKVGDTLVVTRMGGKVEDLGLTVPGAAGFELGGQAIVFLRSTASGEEQRVVGMSQGVLPVDGRAGKLTVRPFAGSAALVQTDDRGKLSPAPDAMLTPQPLDQVLQRIEQHMAGAQAN